MTIAFVCSGLEPGKDGVGDYSRRLAGELIRRGHAAVVLGINDPSVSKTVVEEQEIEGTPVPVLRLSGVASKNRRAAEAREWLRAVNPDWMSLQFVPFGFDSRGLCFGLGNWLAAMDSNAPWHVMFHELWLGLGETATVKDRIWGGAQRNAVLKVIRRLRPRLVHTQVEPYRTALDRVNVKADILPLFSNFPHAAGDGWHDFLEPLAADGLGGRQSRETFYLAGVLGAVHPQWDARKAVETILPLAQRQQKRLMLVFLGKNNVSQESFNKLRAESKDQAGVVVVGERSSAEISKALQALDLGLATTPLDVIQKSGSAVAMLEHGLPVLVIRDDWHLRGTARQPAPASNRLFISEQFARLNALPVRNPAWSGDHGVKQVASQLLAALESIGPAGA